MVTWIQNTRATNTNSHIGFDAAVNQVPISLGYTLAIRISDADIVQTVRSIVQIKHCTYMRGV